MPEPTVPEQVYLDAARAWRTAEGLPAGDVRTLDDAQDPCLRAAVESAYRAGILAAQRAALLSDQPPTLCYDDSGSDRRCRRVAGHAGQHSDGSATWLDVGGKP